jgi:YjjG family noncanonical pyrimidine nucleotidase
MNKFDILLFDLDRTLFDFDYAERYGIEFVLEKMDIEFNKENFKTYKDINHALWARFEKGEVTAQFVEVNRFKELFQSLGIKKDYEKACELYSNYLAQSNKLIPMADEVCEKLRKYCRLAIVTNGIASIQHPRIDKSSIKQYFSNVFISEEIGIQKPNKGFFDSVFEQMEITNKQKVLIIGDSLKTDILGGNLSGIKTCWFNPQLSKNTTTAKPDFEIRELTELYSIVL